MYRCTAPSGAAAEAGPHVGDQSNFYHHWSRNADRVDPALAFPAAMMLLLENERRQTPEPSALAQRCYMKCGFQVCEKLVEEMSNGNHVKRYKMEIVF